MAPIHRRNGIRPRPELLHKSRSAPRDPPAQPCRLREEAPALTNSHCVSLCVSVCFQFLAAASVPSHTVRTENSRSGFTFPYYSTLYSIDLRWVFAWLKRGTPVSCMYTVYSTGIP